MLQISVSSSFMINFNRSGCTQRPESTRSYPHLNVIQRPRAQREACIDEFRAHLRKRSASYTAHNGPRPPSGMGRSSRCVATTKQYLRASAKLIGTACQFVRINYEWLPRLRSEVFFFHFLIDEGDDATQFVKAVPVAVFIQFLDHRVFHFVIRLALLVILADGGTELFKKT